MTIALAEDMARSTIDLSDELLERWLAPVLFLPARASEQGNVIGSVSVYIYIYIYIYIRMSSKKNCN